MSYTLRWQLIIPALAAALGLAGCGSSDSDSLSGQVTGGTAVNPDSSVAPDPTGATAPTQTGNIAALNLYLASGGKVTRTAYWLYR